MATNIGIDVSKHTLDWCPGASGKIQQTKNEPRCIASLVRRVAALKPQRIIIESTGGYERKLVLKLAETNLPVIVVNPRRVRNFGEGMGMLAKTDAIDAKLLVLYGEKAQPPIRPILQGRDRLLADLVARRRQLIAALVGVAPFAKDSGQYRGRRSIRGGRASVRTALYLAAMTASRFNPKMREVYQRLRESGKPPKLAFIAIARKLLVALNAIARERRAWQP
jgi:transposase